MNTHHGRKRGVILTKIGSRKLSQAKATVEIENNFKRYTLESLSEETGLTPTTLSKIFTSSAGVDKRSLKCCFEAFNLTLGEDDYLYVKPKPDNFVEIDSLLFAKTCSDFKLANDSSVKTICDLRATTLHPHQNSPQTNQMDQSRDDLQSHLPTLPGGQMPLDSVFYVDRPMIESLCYEAMGQSGTLVNIRASKQMGKTSLMTRILAYAKIRDYHTVSLNLQLADGEILSNLERFLQWFCARVSKQLGLPNQTADFWDKSLGSKSNATDYLEDVILPKCDRPLVIAIDELHQLFTDPNIAREFLLLLRTWSEKAKLRVNSSNPWPKLRLVTVYSTEILPPSSLPPSLLNMGRVINLPEFTLPQVQDLAHRYQQEITKPQIKQLITLLGGHPYRLQLAFYNLHQQTITIAELLENPEIVLSLYGEHLQQRWWNLQLYPQLLPMFTQIVSNAKPLEIEVSVSSQLQKMALVHLKGDLVSLSCELFRLFFHESRLNRAS